MKTNSTNHAFTIKKISGVIIGLMFFSSGYSSIEEKEVQVNYSLQKTIKQAIEHDPNVEFKWHAFLASAQQINANKAGFRPNIDLNADYGIEWRDYGPNSSFSGGNINLLLTQMLFDGQRTKSTVGASENEMLATYFELKAAVEQTTLSSYTTYQDLLRYRELVRLSQNNYQAHMKIFHQIQSSANAGAIRRVDLEQAQGRLALAETNLKTEKSNLHDVSARYLRIVGATPPNETTPFQLANIVSLPSSSTDALEAAYILNPEFNSTLRRIDASESQVSLQKSERLPQLNLTGRYGVRDYDQFGNSTTQQDARIALELNYNFYSGGRKQANIKRAIDEVAVATSLHHKTCVDMRQTLQIAYNDYVDIEARIPSLEKHRQSSNNVRAAYKAQFEIGQRSLLDMLDSENEFFEASRAYTNALYDHEMAYARTLSSMGELLSSLAIIRDGLPSLEELGAEPYNLKPSLLCPAPEIDIMKAFDLIDTDGDGVPDHIDMCPDTPIGHKVDQFGCTIYQEININERVQINFAEDSNRISDEFIGEVEKLALLLNKHADTVIKLEGHSSLGVSESYNLELSKRRAEAVKDMLINRFEIEPSRITTTGYGWSRLLINARTPEANAINQRIEAIISGQNLEALLYN